MEAERLAERLGVTGRRLRGHLREHYPREAQAKGSRWDIPQDIVDKVIIIWKAKGYKVGNVTPKTNKSAEVIIPGVEFVKVPPGVQFGQLGEQAPN